MEEDGEGLLREGTEEDGVKASGRELGTPDPVFLVRESERKRILNYAKATFMNLPLKHKVLSLGI